MGRGLNKTVQGPNCDWERIHSGFDWRAFSRLNWDWSSNLIHSCCCWDCWFGINLEEKYQTGSNVRKIPRLSCIDMLVGVWGWDESLEASEENDDTDELGEYTWFNALTFCLLVDFFFKPNNVRMEFFISDVCVLWTRREQKLSTDLTCPFYSFFFHGAHKILQHLRPCRPENASLFVCPVFFFCPRHYK